MRIDDTVTKSNGYEVVALLQSERKGQGPNREAAGKFAPLQAGLVAQLEANSDATLQMHCQIWEQEHGLCVSMTTMGRAIRGVGWTRKNSYKTVFTPQHITIQSQFQHAFHYSCLFVVFL
jgi:hypothetical protein